MRAVVTVDIRQLMVEVEVPNMFPLLGKHAQESTLRLEVIHVLEASGHNVFGFHDGTISIDDVLLEKDVE